MKFLRLVFGLLVFFLVASLVRWEEIKEEVEKVNFFYFSLFFLYSFLLIGVSARKWQILMESSSGEKISFAWTFRLYFYSYFFNYFIPLGLAGADISRAVMASKNISPSKAVSTVIFDRASGIVTFFIVGTICLFLSYYVPPSVSALSGLLTLISIVLLFGISLLPKLKFLKRLDSIGIELRAFLQQPKLLLSCFGYSSLFYTLAIFNIVFGGWLVDWRDIKILELAGLVPFVMLFASLPITVQGLGIQEGGYFWLFQFCGASSSQAFTVALLLRAKLLLLALLAFVIWLLEKKCYLSWSKNC
jgi:uncharacterized membrane protein YbhN (UPF0104 family)